jgi:hypothetical protein
MLTRVTLFNNTMYSENTKFELKQFEVMSDILKQLKFVLFWFLKLLTEHLTILSLRHPAARQFCRSTYTITDITIK